MSGNGGGGRRRSRALFVDKTTALRRVRESDDERQRAQNESLEFQGTAAAVQSARGARQQQMQLQTYEAVQSNNALAIDSFAALLEANMPSDIVSSDQIEAYRLGVYCSNAQRVLAKALRVVCEEAARSAQCDVLSERERSELKTLRAQWNDHLRSHFHTLWLPPPNSGGRTASFSLATQLWLLVAHANCILQHTDAPLRASLQAFQPARSDYLLRNVLVVDAQSTLHYTLHALQLSLDTFVERLDTLDGFHGDYLRYVTALEHAVSRFVCYGGRGDTVNVRRWRHVNASGGKQSVHHVNDLFVVHSMIQLRTVYMYAENYLELARPIGNEPPPASPLAPRRATPSLLLRVPLVVCRAQRWFAPDTCVRAMLVFLHRYASDLQDQIYRDGIGDYLAQFLLRPCDLDVYRQATHDNNAPISLARVHQFDYVDYVANRYRGQVHFDRAPVSYVVEALQWADGARDGAQSVSLGTQHFVRQLALLYLFHQCLHGKYGFDFKKLCVLYHRDPAFVTTLARAHQLPYPIIVQQFGQFALLVPRHSVASARASPQAREKVWPERVYECGDVVDALVNWCVHLLHMSGGRVDKKINLARFIDDVLGPAARAAADAFATRKPQINTPA